MSRMEADAVAVEVATALLHDDPASAAVALSDFLGMPFSAIPAKVRYLIAAQANLTGTLCVTAGRFADTDGADVMEQVGQAIAARAEARSHA